MTEIRTRIAPSPTGMLHVGTARTALFNYLFAKQAGGTFSIRIEDTDKERSKPEYERDILEGLAWLGLEHDELSRQSEAQPLHTKELERLVQSGAAYLSKEASTNEPGRVIELVRLKNPNTKITFSDLVRGDITFDTTELGDFVIARALDDPLYHFAVVADDHATGITHVIRGEDHISNTPRQILILEALGYERPQYAHIPLLLDEKRAKLSKRTHSTAIADYRARGYLPEALVNYLALLGWNPGTDQELFSMEELVKAFSITDVQKGGAVFDETRLRWFNREYLKQKPESEVLEALRVRRPDIPEERLKRALPAILERLHIYEDIADHESFGYLNDTIDVPKDLLVWKKGSPEDAKRHLEQVRNLLHEVPEKEWGEERVKDAVWDYAEQEGRGDVLWPLRVAFSGQKASPDPFALAAILGKEVALSRISRAIDKL